MRYFLLFLVSVVAFADVKHGKELYSEACASCHAESGKGVSGLNFKINPRDLTKTILTKDQMSEIIKKGTFHYGSTQNIMVAYEGIYKDQDINDIAEYVTEVISKESRLRAEKLYAQTEPVAENKKHKMIKTGRKIYMRNCSWCHGVHGKADGAATQNPPESIFPYDFTKSLLNKEQFFLYAKYGAHEWGAFKTDMPAWGKKYDDYKLKSVARYLDEVVRGKKEN
jgi:mono/diheme cytochrome c family protein